MIFNENEILMQLKNNPIFVDEILKNLNIDLKYANSNSTVRFDINGKTNNAFSFNRDTMSYYDFRSNKGGNFIDMISEISGESKQDIMQTIYLKLVMEDGFALDIDIDSSNDVSYEFELKYPESFEKSDLYSYPNVISDLFLKDNIWVTTQIAWDIRYDYSRQRVVIPVYQDYELVGAIGRLNKEKVEKNENKYFPIIRYSKSLVLFGLDYYRDLIKETKKVILVESEKSTIKSSQFKEKIPVLAIGGSSISRTQIERLNLLGVEHIVWSQDKGVEEPLVLQHNIERLKRYSNPNTKLYYIDSDSCVELTDKEAVFDKSEEEAKKIIKKYIKKIN